MCINFCRDFWRCFCWVFFCWEMLCLFVVIYLLAFVLFVGWFIGIQYEIQNDVLSNITR